MLSTAALVLFILVVTADADALIVDGLSLWGGWPTLTSMARKNWWLAAAIILWQLLGAAALAIHLWA